MAKRFLLLQHAVWTGPGLFMKQAAKALKVELETVKVWQRKFPDFAAYDGLIVIGGRLDDHSRSMELLEHELAFIRQWLAADRPYLGLGLGHLLLAEAQGARIGRNYCASIGFVEGHLTRHGREHPVFKRLPIMMSFFKWHDHSVLEPLPKSLSVLATSVECQVEAISIPGRPHIIGVQFVNHAGSHEDVEKYWQKDSKWVNSLNGKFVNPLAILAESRKNHGQMAREFEVFFRNFIRLC
ncbi:MAG: type 1 glutamine amidotransferase [Proteobacteria bacterium]|nr:type 1 glutamine amidotransferase [Desulfobulbaceae bacterium]MBU4154283.1 type 1 glutamine amidotransferase [Pseudomonadota bacterium]